ncbi:uncharacterized protein [Zea mays]|uniref:uncharacterized protein n=1 Tax=Zea mays TaxID=4577 RepID=UPI0016529549|nr:uncharacterized protein LOC118473181 [Zea mays]
MVLIDEEGGSAHAQIYPPLAVVFKPMIKEGNVYNISYVQIRKANRMYKPVDNDIMICHTRYILCLSVPSCCLQQSECHFGVRRQMVTAVYL